MEVATWIAAIAAVIAVTIAISALFGQRSGDRRLQALENMQRELLAIEQRRVERDDDAERQRTELEAEKAKAALDEALTAELQVMPRFPRPNSPRNVSVLNRGPHDALLYTAKVWNGARDRPAITTEFPLPDDGQLIEAGRTFQFAAAGVGSGTAWVQLEWSDGRDGAWRDVFPIEMLERPGV